MRTYELRKRLDALMTECTQLVEVWEDSEGKLEAVVWNTENIDGTKAADIVGAVLKKVTQIDGLDAMEFQARFTQLILTAEQDDTT